MFLGTPMEEVFRVAVWLLLGIPLVGFILWLGLTFFAITSTFAALMLGVMGAMVLYVVGIPLAVYNRFSHRWD